MSDPSLWRDNFRKGYKHFKEFSIDSFFHSRNKTYSLSKSLNYMATIFDFQNWWYQAYPLFSRDCSYYHDRLLCSKFGRYGDSFGIQSISGGIEFKTFVDGNTTAWNCPQCGCRNWEILLPSGKKQLVELIKVTCFIVKFWIKRIWAEKIFHDAVADLFTLDLCAEREMFFLKFCSVFRLFVHNNRHVVKTRQDYFKLYRRISGIDLWLIKAPVPFLPLQRKKL